MKYSHRAAMAFHNTTRTKKNEMICENSMKHYVC